MLNLIFSRAKAFAAIAAPAIVLSVIKAFEQSMNFDIPTEYEIGIVSILTGWLVHDVPNKAVPEIK